MTIQQNYPTTRPSLSLNFARSRRLDPHITFTRTTSGTRVNEEGYIETVAADRPRFDHDPVTLEPRGLLIEEGGTNYYAGTSSAYTDSGGFSVNTTLATSRTADANLYAPNGQPAFLYRALDGSNFHGFGGGQVTGIGATTTISYSCWVRDYNNSDYRLYFVLDAFNPTTSNSNYFLRVARPLTGAFAGGGDGTRWTNTSTRVENWGNGWYRFSMTGTYNFEAGRTVIGYGFQLLDNTSAQFYTPSPSNTFGLYAYGPQLEFGPFTTSYIPVPSGSTTATRTADNASITGTKFSSFYNPSEWTLMVTARRNYSGNFISYPNLLRMNDGTLNNNVGFYGAQGSTQFTNYGVNSGGVNQTDYVARFLPDTSQFKMIQALKINDSTFGVNGTLTTTDTTVTMPTGINRMVIGSDGGGGQFWGGTIQQIVYYPAAFTNAQLQELTK